MNNTVLVTGVFDLLHLGHVYLLTKAAAMGKLIVGVESDSRTRQAKGYGRPYWNQSLRMSQLEALGIVRRVLSLPDSMNQASVRQQLLDDLNPDLLVVSSSSPHQQSKAKMMEAIGGNLVTIDNFRDYSSTSLSSNLEYVAGMVGYKLRREVSFDPNSPIEVGACVLGRYLGYCHQDPIMIQIGANGLEQAQDLDLKPRKLETAVSLKWLLSPLNQNYLETQTELVAHVHNYLQRLRLQA